MSKDHQIKIAIAGVGNCAQALLTGVEYYRQNPEDRRGLINHDVGGYKVYDIVPVAAFDISANKVGKDLSQAIFAEPNKAYRYPGIEMKPFGVTVQKGPVFDGNPPHLARYVPVSDATPVNVGKILKESGADMLVNIIPTESHDAAHFYADAAIKEAKIGFLNMMPTLIACDPAYQKLATENGVPMFGDDGKSQFGGSIIHRALATLMLHRGIHLSRTYQINFAGNTDFANLMARGESKHKTKKETVTSLMPYPVTMSTGFTYVEMMGDRKTSLFKLEGANFGNAPLIFEAKLEVEDSANLGGILVEIIRHVKLALDRGISGVLDSSCSYFAKHPPRQIPDEEAYQQVDDFINGKRER
jgi:myo-inositol-1-phosphate synthase